MRIKCNIQFLWLFAHCTMILASCSSDSLSAESEEGTVPITFTAESQKDEPRSRDTGSTTFTGSDFGVFAYYHAGKDADGKSIMENQQVNNTGTSEAPSWTYYPQKYWPTGENEALSFYAYAPHTDGSTSDGSVSYSLDGTQDVLWAYQVNQTDDRQLTYSESGGKVSFAFKHLMMKLVFQFMQGEGFTSGHYATRLYAIGMKETMALHVKEGTYTVSGTKDYLLNNDLDRTYLISETYAGGSNEGIMYIIPEPDTDGNQTVNISVMVSGIQYHATLSLDKAAAGNNYKVELKFTNSTLNPTVTLEPWQSGLDYQTGTTIN